MDKESIETHPCFPKDLPFNIKNAKILILGTFPPEGAYKGRRFFYYQSEKNEFWKIMGKLFFNDENHFKLISQEEISQIEQNIQEKKEFLHCKKIALADIYTKIKRKENTSNDSDLEPVNYWEDLINNVKETKIEKVIVPLGVYNLLRRSYRKIQKEKGGDYNVGKKSKFYNQYIMICPSFSKSSYRRSKIKDLKEKTNEFKEIFENCGILKLGPEKLSFY